MKNKLIFLVSIFFLYISEVNTFAVEDFIFESKSIEIEIIIDSCNLIKNNNLKFLELFNFSKKVDFQECTILYILENRVCVLRKSQIALHFFEVYFNYSANAIKNFNFVN